MSLLWHLHGLHLLRHPLHARPQLLPHHHLLRGIMDEQLAGPGSNVWFTQCSLPDGCCGTEGLPAGLLRHEPVHRVDDDDGRQSGLAALCGQVLAGAGCRPGDHHLPRLHPRDDQARAAGRLWLLSSGDNLEPDPTLSNPIPNTR